VTPRRLLAVPVVAALALSACGDSTRPAATVDGTSITQQDVVDELEAIRDNTTYVDAIEGGGAGQPVLGEEEDAFNSAFVAEQLAVRIQYTIVANEVDARGLRADDECRAAARDAVTARLSGASPEGDGEAVLETFPEEYQDYLVGREADVLLLQGDLVGQPCVADDAVGEYFAEHEDEFLQACAAHILVATREEADEVVALLDGGADFAALAAERSTDTGSAQNGGELPCVSPGQFVAPFDAALFSQPVGEVGEPVETEFGFHVIRVDSRETPELADVREQVGQTIAAQVQEAFGTWFADALAAADVEVDARYGTWDPATAGIVRPSTDSASTTTTTPAAEG
jgi:foldase protein PrsA